jgi:uncharacterized membrane protein YoaT (DUF817 family)
MRSFLRGVRSAAGASGWRELIAFGYHNAAACLFPAFIFALLALSQALPLPLARYDFLLLGCLVAQLAMIGAGLESADEVRVILVFHALGLTLELFKTHVGSWSYPEPALTKLFGVPLYSGFMYASVASFMVQAWRRFDLALERWPRPQLVVALGTAIYLNFFSHHWLPDLRWPLLLAVVVLFARSRVAFTPWRRRLRLPLPLCFVLIGLFVYFAENIATFLGAWVYPHQQDGWHWVGLGKLSSWSLLVIVSFLIVAQLKRVKARRAGET